MIKTELKGVWEIQQESQAPFPAKEVKILDELLFDDKDGLYPFDEIFSSNSLGNTVTAYLSKRLDKLVKISITEYKTERMNLHTYSCEYEIIDKRLILTIKDYVVGFDKKEEFIDKQIILKLV